MTTRQGRTKVLMVYPKFPPSFWSFDESIKLLGLGAVMPPTGLATVAAMLPAEHFIVLPIVDLNLRDLKKEDLEQVDMIMVSAMVVQKESFREIIRQAKNMGKTVVAGGIYPTLYREEVIEMGADHLVLHEAELTLQPFIDDWLQNMAWPIYDEVNVRARSNTVLTREGKPILSASPIPRWDLLDLSSYSKMAVQFSRGCPFNCEFCGITTQFGHLPRTKSPAQFIAEIEPIFQTGWRGSVFVVDDNFIGNRAVVRKLLPVLAEWQAKHGYPFSFFTEASLDLASDSLRDIREGMVCAGFDEVFCGIESVNPEVLCQMNKKQNQGDLQEKVEILQRSGLEVTGGFIIGNDSDKETVFDDLFSYIQKSGIVVAMTGLLTAMRNTDLHDRLVAEGRIRTESSGNNTHEFEFNFIPKLDKDFLIRGYVALLEKLYSSRNYYARCRALRQRMTFRHKKILLNCSSLMAALKIFIINIFKRPDPEFVKYIFSTLITAPSKIGEAIKQAVILAHLQKITKAAVSAHRYPIQVESLTNRFLRRAASLHGNTDKCLKKLSHLEERALKKASKIYNSLDPGFRAGAKNCYENCCSRLQIYADTYRHKWLNAATMQQ